MPFFYKKINRNLYGKSTKFICELNGFFSIFSLTFKKKTDMILSNLRKGLGIMVANRTGFMMAMMMCMCSMRTFDHT